MINYTMLPVFQIKNSISASSLTHPPFYTPSGTRIQASAWDHASPWVQDHVSHMATISEYSQGSMEISVRFALSLADGIVLMHRMGLTNAAKVVLSVDPWCYPGC